MKRKLLYLILSGVASIGFKLSEVKAQQDPYMTHYMFNRALYNPAVAGAKDLFCVSVLSHFQYVGYEDRTPEFWPKDASNPLPKGDVVKNVGPKTQGFTFTAPVTQYGGFGIGFMNDRLGYERSTHIKLNLAGRYPLASGATVSAGVDINF